MSLDPLFDPMPYIEHLEEMTHYSHLELRATLILDGPANVASWLVECLTDEHGPLVFRRVGGGLPVVEGAALVASDVSNAVQRMLRQLSPF